MSELNIGKDLEDKIKQIMLDYFYPVGSLYLTMKSGLPDTYLGGTWEKIGVGKTLWGASAVSDLGVELKAGLPNITGYIYGDEVSRDCAVTCGGAFTFGGGGVGGFMGGNFIYKLTNGFKMDASKSNSIYGNSTTVQPPAIKVFFWKRIA